MAKEDGQFADNAKDFYLTEFEAHRTQLGWLLQDYRALERNAVIAVGVTWGWLFKQTSPAVPKWAWFVPFLFAVLGSLRALGIAKASDALVKYMKRLEDAFSHANDPGGWENFSQGSGRAQVKAAYVFWIILVLVTLVVGVIHLDFKLSH